jgi:nitric oxide reductase large subunit
MMNFFRSMSSLEVALFTTIGLLAIVAWRVCFFEERPKLWVLIASVIALILAFAGVGLLGTVL